jgi:hypothetical protein
MKYEFKGGVSAEGDLNRILEVGKLLGEAVDLKKVEGFSESSVPAGYYLSSKDGLVELKTMNNFHVRNAIVKHTKEYVAVLGKKRDLTDDQFLTQLEKLSEDATIASLFTELISRVPASK